MRKIHPLVRMRVYTYAYVKIEYIVVWPPLGRVKRKRRRSTLLTTKIIIITRAFELVIRKFQLPSAPAIFLVYEIYSTRSAYDSDMRTIRCACVRVCTHDLLLAVSPATGAWRPDPWINEFQDRSRNDTEILITRKMVDINKRPPCKLWLIFT